MGEFAVPPETSGSGGIPAGEQRRLTGVGYRSRLLASNSSIIEASTIEASTIEASRMTRCLLEENATRMWSKMRLDE
jgi:hypothetical protein